MHERKTSANGFWARRGRLACAAVTGMALIGSTQIRAQERETTPDKRLENATLSFREVIHAPDKGIPHDLFDEARCIVIIPGVKKAAFIVGGKYGRGIVSCGGGGGGGFWGP